MTTPEDELKKRELHSARPPRKELEHNEQDLGFLGQLVDNAGKVIGDAKNIVIDQAAGTHSGDKVLSSITPALAAQYQRGKILDEQLKQNANSGKVSSEQKKDIEAFHQVRKSLSQVPFYDRESLTRYVEKGIQQKAQTERPQINKPLTERPQTDKPVVEKNQVERPQVHKSQTENVSLVKLPNEKPASEKNAVSPSTHAPDKPLARIESEKSEVVRANFERGSSSTPGLKVPGDGRETPAQQVFSNRIQAKQSDLEQSSLRPTERTAAPKPRGNSESVSNAPQIAPQNAPQNISDKSALAEPAKTRHGSDSWTAPEYRSKIINSDSSVQAKNSDSSVSKSTNEIVYRRSLSDTRQAFDPATIERLSAEKFPNGLRWQSRLELPRNEASALNERRANIASGASNIGKQNMHEGHNLSAMRVGVPAEKLSDKETSPSKQKNSDGQVIHDKVEFNSRTEEGEKRASQDRRIVAESRLPTGKTTSSDASVQADLRLVSDHSGGKVDRNPVGKDSGTSRTDVGTQKGNRNAGLEAFSPKESTFKTLPTGKSASAFSFSGRIEQRYITGAEIALAAIFAAAGAKRIRYESGEMSPTSGQLGVPVPIVRSLNSFPTVPSAQDRSAHNLTVQDVSMSERFILSDVQTFSTTSNISAKRFLTGAEILLASLLATSGVSKIRQHFTEVDTLPPADNSAAAQPGLRGTRAAQPLSPASSSHLPQGIRTTKSPSLSPAIERQSQEKTADNLTHSEPQAKMTHANPSTLRRMSVLIGLDDTFVSISEKHFETKNLAWLIADLNIGKVRETYIDGNRILEIASRTSIDLPSGEDITAFIRNQKSYPAPETLITIVKETQVDQELLNSELSMLVEDRKLKPASETI